ncbi:MAG: glycerophosphodiester phosphodiesterase [Chloroflexota bacterium]|nr:glycerophosphodiester phosphodiesterase [Chloroflexota bacterium]
MRTGHRGHSPACAADRTLIFAHRGASYRAPENTLSAFRLARDMGADGIELDVQLSRDGVPVVIHDATVDRTTDGSGTVADLTLAELKRLDAGSWFSSEFAGERIPTLNEVFSVRRTDGTAVGQDLSLNLELKVVETEAVGLEEAVGSLIARCGMEDRVLISSFSPLALQRMRRVNYHLPLALIYGLSLPQAELERWVQELQPLAALHPEHRLVDEAHLAWAWERNCRVNVWTVDELEETQRLLTLGVDGLFTNQPDLLKAILKEEPTR